jgi:diguanylate cyclase (GGDEF)-like protein
MIFYTTRKLLGMIVGHCLVALRMGLAAVVMCAGFCPGTLSAADRWNAYSSESFQHIINADNTSVQNPTSLIRDGDGFLWIGTQNGLLRWDGYRFRHYLPKDSDPSSLPDNDIRALATDGTGHLWIGTNSGGLVQYDADKNAFTSYSTGPQGLSHVTVTAIAKDGQFGLWIGTLGGIDHLDTRSGKIEKGQNAGLPTPQIGALLCDAQGNLWIGTAQGLARRSPDGHETRRIQLPTRDGAPASIREIYQDGEGRIWIATQSQGAFYIEGDKQIAHAVVASDAVSDNLQAEGINTIVEVSPGHIWLGTYSHGIVAVDAATLKTHNIVHDPLVSTSLLYDEVWRLYRDPSGLVWVATGEGLSRWAPEQAAMRLIPGATGRTQDMSEPGALAISQMPNGQIWMGLTRKGVDIIDPKKGRLRSLRSDAAHPETALPQNYVWDLLSFDDHVFIATARGLYQSNATGTQVHRVHVKDRDPTAHTITLLSDAGKIWVGGYDGLWRFTPGDEARHADHFDNLTDPRVRAVLKGPDGSLWAGTESGLNRLPPALINGGPAEIEHIGSDRHDAEGLSAGYISSLVIDHRGRLWVGTSGGGISVLTGRNGAGKPRFHHIEAGDGLPNQNIDKLVVDRHGRVWASTDAGLAVIDPDTFRVRALGRESGLSILNYWVGSGTLTNEGEILFSGTTGVLIIQPDKISPWTYAPPVVVSDVHVGKDQVPVGRASAGGLHQRIKVPHGEALSVEFSALDFSAPSQNRFRYRLKGYERAWNEADASRRTATYTNLLPGHYKLVVQGSNRDGVWSPNQQEIPVEILPAWYQTWWFLGLLGALVVLAILGIIKMRTAYLQGRQAELTLLVEERTAELRLIQSQLEHLAYYDALTGLPNRRRFGEDLRKFLAHARREKQSFALLLIDLDHFKHVNDSLGHDAGDALLCEAAIRLRTVLRETDCVARLGGDEFAILLAKAEATPEIDTVCRRIIECFDPVVPFQAHLLKTTPSIGIARFPEGGETEDALYKTADVALYEAKAAGRNTWHYDPSKLRTP